MNTLKISSTANELQKAKRRFSLTIVALFFMLIFLSLAGLCLGPSKLPISDLFAVFVNPDPSSAAYRIFFHVRLPRLLACILSGAALSVAGGILQIVLNNSLAGPNIIGINAGAGFSALLFMILFPHTFALLPVASFIGALFSASLIYFIAKLTGASRITIVLAGVVVTNFIGAGMDTLRTLYPDAVLGSNTFLIGGFSGVTMKNISFAWIYIVIGLVLAFFLSKDMNVLSLGDETARSLGLSVSFYRASLLGIAAVLSGAAVSFSGLLGFVGLLVPHAARIFVSPDNTRVLPVSALLGACFVLFCDILARILFSPFEIPVGILMSFIGCPFFVILLFKKGRGRLYD